MRSCFSQLALKTQDMVGFNGNTMCEREEGSKVWNQIIRGSRADPAVVSDQDSPFESFPDVPTNEPVLQNKHVA